MSIYRPSTRGSSQWSFCVARREIKRAHVFDSLKNGIRCSKLRVRVVQGLAWTGRADCRPVLKTGRLRWTLAGAERPAITDDGAAGDLSAAARPAPLKDHRHA
jgi:hypothetical protein